MADANKLSAMGEWWRAYAKEIEARDEAELIFVVAGMRGAEGDR